MATEAAQLEDPLLEQSRWDLSPLLEGGNELQVERYLEEADRLAEQFASAYKGRVGELDGPGLEQAMRSLERILELVGRASAYAQLSFSTATDDPSRGALLAKVGERGAQLQTKLLFFELEWVALPEERAQQLLAHPTLGFCRHHLRSLRRFRDHMLSEPEERVLSEKEPAGGSAWGRLFEELTSAIQVSVEGEQLVLDAALAELHSPDRQRRKGVAEAVTAALGEGLRTRAFIFNTLLLDKAIEDRLRRYPHWLASRNLANEVSDEAVETLLAAVRRRYGIARRWYRLKAKILGLDPLFDYDRMATIAAEEPRYTYSQARDLVLDSFYAFSERLGEVAERLLTQRQVDAPPKPGKRGGAFAAATVPSVAPYILLNFTGKRRDVLTLAHELGHAVHFALAAKQGIFHQHTPLTVSETASVFGETIVFERLLAEDQNPQSRLALLAENIEDRIATVFRQVAMNRFEQLVHTERREKGELSPDRFGELWLASQRELLGDAVVLTEGYASWWSYIPHFIETPGYVYAYAFGQLFALAIYSRYRAVGKEFVDRYLALLEAGGSLPPRELGLLVDCDLEAAGFWEGGLEQIELQVAEAEELASRLDA